MEKPGILMPWISVCKDHFYMGGFTGHMPLSVSCARRGDGKAGRGKAVSIPVRGHYTKDTGKHGTKCK